MSKRNRNRNYKPVRHSQYTRGKWQIGEGPDAIELNDGDLIAYLATPEASEKFKRGRGYVFHDSGDGQYRLRPTDGGKPFHMAEVHKAMFIGLVFEP